MDSFSPCVGVRVGDDELLLLPVSNVLDIPSLARLVQLVVDPVLELGGVVLDLGHPLRQRVVSIWSIWTIKNPITIYIGYYLNWIVFKLFSRD